MRALIFALLVAAGGLSAQTEAELNIGTYAGLTISGEIGCVYSIDYTTAPGDPDGSDWQCLE